MYNVHTLSYRHTASLSSVPSMVVTACLVRGLPPPARGITVHTLSALSSSVMVAVIYSATHRTVSWMALIATRPPSVRLRSGVKRGLGMAYVRLSVTQPAVHMTLRTVKAGGNW